MIVVREPRRYAFRSSNNLPDLCREFVGPCSNESPHHPCKRRARLAGRTGKSRGDLSIQAKASQRDVVATDDQTRPALAEQHHEFGMEGRCRSYWQQEVVGSAELWAGRRRRQGLATSTA